MLTPSIRTQRLLAGSVAALLTANAFAVASLATKDDGPDRLLRSPQAAAAEATIEPPTVTLITTSDGRTFMADPSTSEGRKAIADAKKTGGTVRSVPVPARTATPVKRGTPVTLPVKADGTLDLGSILGGLTSTTLLGGGGGLLPIDPGIVDQIVKDPVGTATSVVAATPSTITSVVASTPSTITSVVDSTQSTVTSVVNQIPLGPVVNPVVGSTQTSVVGLLGGVVTTVSSVVQSLPTTVPPTTAPPPPPERPICLLVRC